MTASQVLTRPGQTLVHGSGPQLCVKLASRVAREHDCVAAVCILRQAPSLPTSRFYQHIPGSADWEWRMCWGHASSADLVNWEHESIALRPTPGASARSCPALLCRCPKGSTCGYAVRADMPALAPQQLATQFV